jgi:hypothetical protein
VNRPFILSMAAALTAGAILSGCSSPAGTSPGTTRPPVTSAPSTPAATPASGAVGAQQPVQPEKNPPGDIPDNTAFVPFATAGRFSVSVPEGWSRTQSASSVIFTDKLNTIEAAWTPATSAPTLSTVKTTDVPKLQAAGAAFEFTSVTAVTLPAGPAVLLEYRVNSAPNAVTGKQYRLDVQRYTIFRNGTRADVSLISPVGADNVDPWRIVSRSLAWK